MSCEAVIIKFGIVFFPKEFESVNKLERIRVSKRILLKKITIIPKGQTPKIKGTICNISVQEIETNCSIFPRSPNSNGIVIVKLKRKLEYNSHVLFEVVRPEMVAELLTYLKNINTFYKNVGVDLNNIPSELKSFYDLDEEKQISIELLEDLHQPIKIFLEKNEGNIDRSREPEISFASIETVLMGDIPAVTDMEEAVPVAPGESKPPISLLNDRFREEVSHPHLFPTGQVGYNVKCDINLSGSKYFNQRLLNYSQKFAGDSDYSDSEILTFYLHMQSYREYN